jgi:hypothetical protein
MSLVNNPEELDSIIEVNSRIHFPVIRHSFDYLILIIFITSISFISGYHYLLLLSFVIFLFIPSKSKYIISENRMVRFESIWFLNNYKTRETSAFTSIYLYEIKPPYVIEDDKIVGGNGSRLRIMRGSKSDIKEALTTIKL